MKGDAAYEALNARFRESEQRPATTCKRCGKRLDDAAKCALSEVCSTCAVDSGELTPGAVIPLRRLVR